MPALFASPTLVLAADDLPSEAILAQPNTTKSAKDQVDVSKFLPPAWGPWLEDNDEDKTSNLAAQSGMHKAEIATARVLDECTVLSGVLRDELAKAAAKLT